jgi:hypothetical protein
MPRSRAARMTHAQAEAFAASYPWSEDHPCEHGHLGCSDRDGGACLDEVLTIHSLDDTACPQGCGTIHDLGNCPGPKGGR